ncbi:hypothetical protein ACFQRD_12655 [Brachybacterium sp. GCM10030268]|uniref:hypothetical protein n=1 Tax=Brachybacterium sp. GCM10030268 TaxID=3273382 RepID=UPI0036157ECD
MTRGDHLVDDHVTWDGSSRAVAMIRDLVTPHSSEGTLRIVVQQVTVREQGRESGIHEVIDAITDVGGNLVSIPLTASVRGDEPTSARLDTAIERLRADIAADLAVAVDSLEVVLDGDGAHQVRVAFAVEVSAGELTTRSAHPALHDGAHHIVHHAPALEELRDRLAGPPPGPLRRALEAVRGWTRARVPRVR